LTENVFTLNPALIVTLKRNNVLELTK